VDPPVLKVAAKRGYRLDSTDPFDQTYIDEHRRGAACQLTELQLLDETPESLASLIDELHRHMS